MRSAPEPTLMPAETFCCNPPTRTMKNSSRFEAKMARNLMRSSIGTVGSSASSSTRRLNASQLSSRLMYKLGSSKGGSKALSDLRTVGVPFDSCIWRSPLGCQAYYICRWRRPQREVREERKTGQSFIFRSRKREPVRAFMLPNKRGPPRNRNSRRQHLLAQSPCICQNTRPRSGFFA